MGGDYPNEAAEEYHGERPSHSFERPTEPAEGKLLSERAKQPEINLEQEVPPLRGVHPSSGARDQRGRFTLVLRLFGFLSSERIRRRGKESC